jgi:hypothetical protein
VRSDQTILTVTGFLLLVGGVFHVGVWLCLGGPLEGPISWRKPILFCFASGVTSISLAWLAGKLQATRWDNWLALIFGLALLAEVGLICLQQWRGVPSHFNHSTSFDANVLAWIKGLVLVVTLVIAVMTVRGFGPLQMTRDVALAARAGMVLLLISCLLGFVSELHGERQLLQDKSPDIYGDAGVMKFAHGMPMHAIQVLPLIAFGLSLVGLDENQRYKSVLSASIGFWGLAAYAAIQTFSGRSRFDMTAFSAIVLIMSACMLAVPFLAAAMT